MLGLARQCLEAPIKNYSLLGLVSRLDKTAHGESDDITPYPIYCVGGLSDGKTPTRRGGFQTRPPRKVLRPVARRDCQDYLTERADRWTCARSAPLMSV